MHSLMSLSKAPSALFKETPRKSSNEEIMTQLLIKLISSTNEFSTVIPTDLWEMFDTI